MPKPIANKNLVRPHAFKKGDPRPPNTGRKKGTPNRTTKLLKEAILQAAEMVGQDGRGKNGLTGYLMMLAVKEKAVYARLLEKVLPLQLNVEDKTVRNFTPVEVVQQLQERRLPVPAGLLSIVSNEAVTVASLEEEYSDELDGIGYEDEEANE